MSWFLPGYLKQDAMNKAGITPNAPDPPGTKTDQRDPAVDNYYKGWYDAKQEQANDIATTNINTSGSLGFGDSFLPLMMLLLLPSLMGKMSGDDDSDKEKEINN